MNEIKKMERLLAHHEGITNALRISLGLLRGDSVERKIKTGNGVIAQALALDGERRGKVGRPRKQRAPQTGEFSRKKAQARQRTAVLLAKFDTATPRNVKGPKLGVLVQHGYVVRKGDGYIRTSKEFTP